MYLAPTLALLAFAAAPQDEGKPAFTDPAPPEVNELEPAPAPEPQAYPMLKFGAAPRPLRADAVTEDWPAFLGPRRDGRSRETKLLRDWSPGGPQLVWAMQMGQGYASPAVQGEYVVFPHRVGTQTHIDCLQAETGRRFWRVTYETNYGGRYFGDGGPRATPLIDGEHVFVHGVESELHCLELATGRTVWQRDLRDEFELGDGFFGVVASPLVYGDLLVLALGVPGGPSVVAFDKRTGGLVWGSGRKWGASCASPVVATVKGRDRLFVLGGGESRPPVGGLMVIDPKTGKLELEYPFRSRTFESVIGASPVVDGARVFLTASYNTGTAVLELDGEGGFKELWKTRRIGIEFATPLLVDGHVYLVDGVRDRAGAVVCLDPKTGEELARTDLSWDETVMDRGEEKELSFSIGNGSLMHADGDFLCLGDSGHLLWLDCSPRGAKVLARASLFRANQSWVPLVLSRGLLYVCQNKRERFGGEPARLLCFDLRAGS